jgi:hypothetical protein
MLKLVKQGFGRVVDNLLTLFLYKKFAINIPIVDYLASKCKKFYFKILFDRCFVRKITYELFLIDCFFKSYSMGPMFVI